MDEGVFEALSLVGFVLISAGLAFALRKMEEHKNESITRAEKLRDDIGLGLQAMVENMNNIDLDLPDIHIIRETIEDAIGGVMGNMHVPTGQDMVLGALSQFLMAKVGHLAPEGVLAAADSILPPPIVPPEGSGPS